MARGFSETDLVDWAPLKSCVFHSEHQNTLSWERACGGEVPTVTSHGGGGAQVWGGSCSCTPAPFGGFPSGHPEGHRMLDSKGRLFLR